MSFNPYSPPEAKVADALTPDLPSPKPRAITVMQVLGPMMLIAVTYAVVRNFVHIWQWHQIGVDVTRMLINYAIQATIPLLLLYMLFQLPKRTQAGRWLGVLLIAVPFSLLIYYLLIVAPWSGGTVFFNIGQVIGFLLTTAPIAYWLYAFGFSAKARAYFRSSARK